MSAAYYFPRKQEIFNILQDDESMFIYEKLVEYYINGSNQYQIDRKEFLAGVLKFAYQRSQINCDKFVKDDAFVNVIKEYKTKDEIWIFPAGNHAYFTAKILLSYGVEVAGFIDSDCIKQKGFVFERPVISPNNYKLNCDGTKLIICSHASFASIKNAVMDWGFYNNNNATPKPKKIYDCAVLYEQQYFGPHFIKPVEDEVFLDIGTYSGSTIIDFVNFCSNAELNYKKVIGFESSQEMIPIIHKNINRLNNVKILPYGAYSHNDKLEFYVYPDGMSFTTNMGQSIPKIIVPTRRIDDTVHEDVTFIKMDIEGAEIEALKGAIDTIKKCKPRLAISIYHKEKDIIEIPWFIHSLVPEYRFYIRHHTFYPNWETILYAVI